MEFKIKQDTYNPLLKRKEILLEVDHENAGSPSRVSLKDAVATKLSTKSENVFVLDVSTRTGSQSSTCKVEVYDDPDTAKKTVPKHVQIRNLPVEERKKLKESKKAEEPKPEKPKVQKPKTEPSADKPKTDSTPAKEEKTEAKPAAEPAKEKTKPKEGKTK